MQKISLFILKRDIGKREMKNEIKILSIIYVIVNIKSMRKASLNRETKYSQLKVDKQSRGCFTGLPISLTKFIKKIKIDDEL